MAGEARTVGAGALDPDPLHRPEGSQPLQQQPVAGRCRGERLNPQQPADAIQRGGHMHIQMGVHTAGHGARLYDGHCHPFRR
jgi:hypothetical protein